MRRAMPARISATRLLAMSGGTALCLLALSAQGADVEFGRYLSSECTTCHGTAKTDSTIPNIHGLGEVHFTEVIKA